MINEINKMAKKIRISDDVKNTIYFVSCFAVFMLFLWLLNDGSLTLFLMIATSFVLTCFFLNFLESFNPKPEEKYYGYDRSNYENKKEYEIKNTEGEVAGSIKEL